MAIFSNTERQALAWAISTYQKYPDYSQMDVFIANAKNNAWTIGVTGVGGVGKSTLIKSLIKYFRKEQLKVAVLAIDPSSAHDQWAILADRCEMRSRELDSDLGVFFRSLATRGETSALTKSLRRIINHSRVFSDVVIVETAGAGQSDIEIRNYVDTLVEIMSPLGGALTLEKAGQSEHTDIFAINDRDTFNGINKFFALTKIKLSRNDSCGWTKKVFLVNAKERTGIEELILNGLLAHKKFLNPRM